MTMSLNDLNGHIARVREDLEVKKACLERMIFTDPVTGAALGYEIDCLEPRLRELERQALRMTKEREAHADSGTGPIPVVTL